MLDQPFDLDKNLRNCVIENVIIAFAHMKHVIENEFGKKKLRQNRD